MPPRPRRTLPCDSLHRRGRQGRPPATIHSRPRHTEILRSSGCRAEHGRQHPVDRALPLLLVRGTGQCRRGTRAPALPQLRPRPRSRLLRTPGQRGLLGHLVLHMLRCVMPVPVPVIVQRLLVADLDLTATGRELGQQSLRDAHHLTNRQPVTARSSLHEPHPQTRTELILNSGVVRLRRRHRQRVQHPQIPGAPTTVGSLHLRGHRHVGVQVRVPRTRVRMVERGGHQPESVDLRDPRLPCPGQRRMLLDERQRLLPRPGVRSLDLAAHDFVTQGPQHRHRLDRSEHQINARHRPARRTRQLRDKRLQLRVIHRPTPMAHSK